MRRTQFAALADSVCSEILQHLENGTRPWEPPWLGGDGPRNHHTLRYYSGINELILFSAARSRGYKYQRWVTAKQVALLGGEIKPGEKSTAIVLAGRYSPDRAGKTVGFSRLYGIYNAEAQCHGIPMPVPPSPSRRNRNARIETLIGRAGLVVRRGGTAAYYDTTNDRLHVPAQSAFFEPPAFYRTLLHEAAHAFMGKKRLNLAIPDRHPGEHRALAEMAAELAAAFLCRALGLRLSVRSADYIAEWMEILRTARKLAEANPHWLLEVRDHAERVATALLAFDPGV